MTPRKSIIPVFVPHLGCPNMCIFCNQRRISGAVTPATGETVVTAVKEGLSKLCESSEVTLAFYGGSFTAIPTLEQEILLGSALPFLRSGKIASVRLSTRPDCIDDDVLERLKRFGVRTIELGVQSMDEDVLKASLRGHTAGDAVRAAKMVKAAGFELILQMMTGLPMDTHEKSVETARQFIELSPDGVRIYPTVIIKDTTLYDAWLNGDYIEHTVEDAVELCAELADMFEEANIPVIRLGLNPSEELSEGAAAGGAYHPALGELVLNRRYLKLEKSLLSDDDKGKNIVFAVEKGRISAAVGQKKCNVKALRKEFCLRDVKVIEKKLSEGEKIIRIE